ncbi:ATP-binding protein [Pseudoxanthomonas sp. X-1]|uniref:P-loop ATPase, Sll1717 family n=1 Tax=Pseudoxanthomonas sp. X-1 TaxID=2571115 RepID=UPI00110A1DB1|nr:ATP-binding protein [Pseudoxanthomonas sp. X-1]TMN19681.1 ATP-binding protein [Pseudoxanthomonas sp. X-1]UAY74324.1 ATP-binding protein [Pseudoxanthomonas sp. X-1]
MAAKPNAFGDVRGENDHKALDGSFYEWQDYRTLFESVDRFIVVGRRGTGKSAITYRLSKMWADRRTPVIKIAPAEEQMIGLRPLAKMFGEGLSKVRAGIKIAWKYAILMEIGSQLLSDYKLKRQIEVDSQLLKEVHSWRRMGETPIDRMRYILKEFRNEFKDEEERIAELSAYLSVEKLTEKISRIVSDSSLLYVLLVDRLDEGYEPDILGTGIIDGILYGTDEIRSSLAENFRAIVFIRDNMLRAIESEDKDFTRNLESQVLRLHWDPQELFYMVANRIRYAFGVVKESDVKVWNSITANELHGREGFRRCLRLTLYRPRDVIALLNAAFYQAQRQGRSTLVEEDFDESAKGISLTRFNDLGKEYESVFPGLRELTSSFSNGDAKMRFSDVQDIIASVMNRSTLSVAEMQHFQILGSPQEVLKALYGIGFIGIYNKQIASFVYSHDGKRFEKSLAPDDVLMIHPCYWPALNISGFELTQNEAEEIYDEYEISIESQSGEQRRKILGQLMAELNTIPEGNAGATQFENWCKRAIEIAFSKNLTNVQLHANSNATQRRDIIATNQGGGIWRRILDDYKTRQVVFEVKNYSSIGVEEFRQVAGYLGREYGSLAFIVCRDVEFGLRKGGELDAFREFYHKGIVVVKFPAQQLVTILSKLRNPEKVDAGELAVDRLLDTYVRMYASGQSDVPNSASAGKRKRKRKRSSRS